MSKEEIINILQRFINELNQNNIRIEKAYLYGGYAKNSANIDSDIDVMLVSSAFDANYFDDFTLKNILISPAIPSRQGFFVSDLCRIS